jgi:hypothetical protein
LVFGELVGLLFQEQLECSLGQPLRGCGGDLLHGSEIDIQPRPVVTEGTLGDNLSPLGRQSPEPIQFLACKSWCGHGSSCLDVTPKATAGFPLPRRKSRKVYADRELTSEPKDQ